MEISQKDKEILKISLISSTETHDSAPIPEVFSNLRNIFQRMLHKSPSEFPSSYKNCFENPTNPALLLKNLGFFAMEFLYSDSESCRRLLWECESAINRENSLFSGDCEAKNLLFNHLARYYWENSRFLDSFLYVSKVLCHESLEKFKGYTLYNQAALRFQEGQLREAAEIAKEAALECEKSLRLCRNDKEKHEFSHEFAYLLKIAEKAFELAAKTQENAKNFRDCQEIQEKYIRFLREFHGNNAVPTKIAAKNLEKFKERFKLLFKKPTSFFQFPPPQSKKPKRSAKNVGLLHLVKLKPYLQAYNLTENDIFYSKKAWNFKKKPFKINPCLSARNAEKPRFSSNFLENPPLSTANREKVANSSGNLIKIEDHSLKPEENLHEIVSIDENASFEEKRADFLADLKAFSAIHKPNPLEITLDSSKLKGSAASFQSKRATLSRNDANFANPSQNSKGNQQNSSFLRASLDFRNQISLSPASNSLRNANNSPKKAKFLINIKKLNRPALGNSNAPVVKREKAAKLLQRKLRKWLEMRHEPAKFFRIFAHSPSHEIKMLEKSPIKKSRKDLADFSNERNIKGSLLLVFYQKKQEIRASFKVLSLKKLFLHTFSCDALDWMDLPLKTKILAEFSKEIVKSFVIFYEEILMLKEFLNQKNSTTFAYKLSRLVFKEILLEKKDENLTNVAISQRPAASLFPENNEFLDQSLCVDPLFASPLQNISLELIEPLLFSLENTNSYKNSRNSRDSEENSLNSRSPSPIFKAIDSKDPSPIIKAEKLPQKPDILAPLLITLSQSPTNSLNFPGKNENPSVFPKEIHETTENDTYMSQLTIDRFNNIRVFTSFSRNGANDAPDQHSQGNRKETGEEIDAKSQGLLRERENLKNRRASAVKIQRVWRGFLAKARVSTRKAANFHVKAQFIRRKGGILAILRLLQWNSEKFSLIAWFLELSGENAGKSKGKNVFRMDLRKEIALKILQSPQPFVWCQVDYRLRLISIRNMQIYERMFGKLARIFVKRLKYWNKILMNCLVFLQNCDQSLKKLTQNLRKSQDFHEKIHKSHVFKALAAYSLQRFRSLGFYNRISDVFSKKKRGFSRVFLVRLKLRTFLQRELENFSSKVEFFIALSKQRALYKQAIKVLVENSRFKDYLPITKRVLFENKRMIQAFIYYDPRKLELLIVCEDSDIRDYRESLETDEKIKEITLEFQRNSEKLGDLKQILNVFTSNLTLIKENSKSLEKSFKIYSEVKLKGVLRLQKYVLNKLYYRIFEIFDKEYEYRCKVYVHLSTTSEQNNQLRLVLLLKTLPSFVKNIYELPENCLNYLQIANKMGHLENFIEKYVSFNERKQEFVFIPPSNNKWLLKKKKEVFIQEGNEKTLFELGAEIDDLNNKISIRLLKDENKFYKLLIPDDFSLQQRKKFIDKALESCVIYKDEEKVRLLCDDDKYGPLIFRANFEKLQDKTLLGTIRLIESKKFIILLIEFFQNRGLVTVSSSRFAYVTEDQKLKIVEKLKGSINFLDYSVEHGVFLDPLFSSECAALCNEMPSPSIHSKDESRFELNTSEIKSPDRSFHKYSKPSAPQKVVGRSFASKDTRTRSVKNINKKLPKDANFEKEAYPTENSPKVASKFGFAASLTGKKFGSVEKSAETEEKKEINNDNLVDMRGPVSPKTSISIGSPGLKVNELLSPETKEYTNSISNNFNGENSNINKTGANINNNSNANSNKDIINTGKNANPKKQTAKSVAIKENKLENLIEKVDLNTKKDKKTRDNFEIEQAVLKIQQFYRKRLEKIEELQKKRMINAEILEISKNKLHFPNPRRPCDYEIVICKDPYDVLNAILFIQSFMRRIFFKENKKNKNNENLDQAQISLNCEESQSISFLEQINNEDDSIMDKNYRNFSSNNSVNRNNIDIFNNRLCYEKEENE